MKANVFSEQKRRKFRFINPSDIPKILFLKSERPGTYTRIVLKDGGSFLVGYSLHYLHFLIAPNFIKVNKGVLVNKSESLIIENKIIVGQKYVFTFSRNQFKIHKSQNTSNEKEEITTTGNRADIAYFSNNCTDPKILRQQREADCSEYEQGK